MLSWEIQGVQCSSFPACCFRAVITNVSPHCLPTLQQRPCMWMDTMALCLCRPPPASDRHQERFTPHSLTYSVPHQNNDQFCCSACSPTKLLRCCQTTVEKASACTCNTIFYASHISTSQMGRNAHVPDEVLLVQGDGNKRESVVGMSPRNRYKV